MWVTCEGEENNVEQQATASTSLPSQSTLFFPAPTLQRSVVLGECDWRVEARRSNPEKELTTKENLNERNLRVEIGVPQRGNALSLLLVVVDSGGRGCEGADADDDGGGGKHILTYKRLYALRGEKKGRRQRRRGYLDADIDDARGGDERRVIGPKQRRCRLK